MPKLIHLVPFGCIALKRNQSYFSANEPKLDYLTSQSLPVVKFGLLSKTTRTSINLYVKKKRGGSKEEKDNFQAYTCQLFSFWFIYPALVNIQTISLNSFHTISIKGRTFSVSGKISLVTRCKTFWKTARL